MDELISRQAAIDALKQQAETMNKWSIRYAEQRKGVLTAVNIVEDLPSAQPEIIYCKDCKHFVREDREEYTPYGFYNTYFDAFCDKHFDIEQGEFINVKFDDFCSFAERREVTT